MSRILSRVAGGALAILVSAAAGDVAMANAQAQTSTIISTTCGTGTLEKCTDKPITKCDQEYVLEIDPLTKAGKLVLKITNCKVIGTIPLYKNRYGACGATGGGSTGTGLVGTRGSGEEVPTDDSGETCG